MVQTPSTLLRPFRPCAGRPPAHGGVTLIELLVVMAILAVAAAIGGSAVAGGVDNFRLRSAGRNLLSEFRLVRTQARLEQTPHVALIDRKTVRILKDGALVQTIDLPASVEFLYEPDGAPPAFFFLASGQIVGPARLQLVNTRGRRGVLTSGPVPGTLHFVEETP